MNLLVVNGEQDWAPYFPEFSVHHRKIQTARWVLREDNSLFLLDEHGALRVDAVLWRVGAIRADSAHRSALELIRLAGVPCVNSAKTLLRGFDRLSMLAELREIGLPMLNFACALGDGALDCLRPNFPAVLKIGNWHGGLGKSRIETQEQWLDARDLAAVSAEYSTVENWVNYRRDVRILAVGEEIFGMERRSEEWKVNRGTVSPILISPPKDLADWTRAAQKHLNADALALDFLEAPNGDWLCLESNDVPGFTGFPPRVRELLAKCFS